MKHYTETKELGREFARTCMICKLYWALTRRSTRGGGASLSYLGAGSFHGTLDSALSSIESARTRGSRFELHEIPALFFPCDTRRRSLHHACGLVVAEVNTNSPFASCGTLAVTDPNLISIGDQFTLGRGDFAVMEAPAELPALKREMLAWRSNVVGPGFKLDWNEIPSRAWDHPHPQPPHAVGPTGSESAACCRLVDVGRGVSYLVRGLNPAIPNSGLSGSSVRPYAECSEFVWISVVCS